LIEMVRCVAYDRSSGKSLRTNRFLHCASSPLLRKMICGPLSLGGLLDNEGLRVSREKAVLEAVVMKAGEGEPRGRGLLSKIRYRVMDSE
jgi:hypothetical protein